MKNFKRFLAILLIAVLAVSTVPMTAFASDTATETVEEKDPQAIYTADDFMAMQVGGNYYLANDIDLSGVTKPGKGYYYVSSFAGVLDGRGHKITGVNINATLPASDGTQYNLGIFEKLGSANKDTIRITTVITNLNIEGASITVRDESSYSGRTAVGVLAGGMNGYYGVTIDNVHISADIDVKLTAEKDAFVGGFMGDVYGIPDVQNSSYSGAIKLDRGNASKYVGGIIGYLRNNASYIGTFRNCVNNADIEVANVTTVNTYSGIGGILGVARSSVYMIDCVNNGDITSATSDIAGMVGAIWTNKNDVFAVIADCVNNGSTKHEIYGDTTTNVGKVLRLFVYGCKIGTAASAQNLPVYDETMTDAVAGKVIIPIKTADDFAKIGNTEANALYTADAFYLLDGENGKIDFTGKTYANYVVNNFSGVLYGNNNVLENITLNADSHVGFFRFLSNTNSTAVMKLDFGSEGNEIKITQSNENLRNVGVLASEVGVSSPQTTYDTLVVDVDFYMDIDIPHGYYATGAIAGKTMLQRYGIYDCDVYGSITAPENTAAGSDCNIGVYVGNTASHNSYKEFYRSSLVDCDSFCDVNIGSATPSGKVVRAGYLGYNVGTMVTVLDCTNFGDLTVNSASGGNVTAFVTGINHGSGSVAVVDCVNFGKFNTTGTKGTAIAHIADAASVMINSVIDYGNNGAEAIGANPNGKTASAAGCTSASVVTMEKGASVRIDPDPKDAGIRFKSEINEEAYKILVSAFGEDAVSYGTLIAPSAFVERAGEFTADKLEAWADGVSGLEPEEAYIDVTANGWYTGDDYVFAGSLNGLDCGTETADDDMFDVLFSARSYVKVNTGNDTLVFWSDYNSTDNSRSIVVVTEKALADVLYKKSDDADTWYTDEACTVVYEKDNTADYVTVLGTTDNVTKYTCYTEQQYADLSALYGAIVPAEQ